MTLRKVFHVGPLNKGSSCNPRVNGLKALGLDVDTLDTSSMASSRFRVLNSLTLRTYLTPSVVEMNAILMKKAAECAPDLVWIDKGTWVYPTTLRRLKRYSKFIVHHHTDDIHGKGSYFWLHRIGMGLYDLHMTTNRWNVLEMRQKGFSNIFRVGMGYDQDHHLPPSGRNFPCLHEIVFVGHWEPHSERYVIALREAGMEVKVWGHNWRKAADPSLRHLVPLSSDEYIHTIAGSRIALCFLSHRNRNESTGRSFEIPSIGAFLLAERTDEHEYLYGDGIGAALFRNEQKLVEKAKHYLGNESERREVAAVGHSRCISMGLSWGDHMRREWPLVERYLHEGKMPVEGKDDAPFWTGFRRGDPADAHLADEHAASVACRAIPDPLIPACKA